MSYEGFEEYLCEDGHYYTLDSSLLWYIDKHPKCYTCGKKAKYWNSVDQTNDEGVLGKKKVKKKISGYCSCCDKEHICEVTYKPGKGWIELK